MASSTLTNSGSARSSLPHRRAAGGTPTTNQIESINYQLRKITKTRGSFPSDEAAIKLVYLGIRNIETRRGGELGTGTQGWHQALNAFAVQFPNRLPL